METISSPIGARVKRARPPIDCIVIELMEGGLFKNVFWDREWERIRVYELVRFNFLAPYSSWIREISSFGCKTTPTCIFSRVSERKPKASDFPSSKKFYAVLSSLFATLRRSLSLKPNSCDSPIYFSTQIIKSSSSKSAR